MNHPSHLRIPPRFLGSDPKSIPLCREQMENRKFFFLTFRLLESDKKTYSDFKCILAIILFWDQTTLKGKCLSPERLRNNPYRSTTNHWLPRIFCNSRFFRYVFSTSNGNLQICKSFWELWIDILDTIVCVSLAEHFFHSSNLQDNGLLIRVHHRR